MRRLGSQLVKQTFIVRNINQALYFGNSLPRILQTHGVQVDDVPQHLSRGKSSNSIYFEEEKVRIP
jgi:hypothetical protein